MRDNHSTSQVIKNNLIDLTNSALIISSLFAEVTFGSMSAERLCDMMESGQSAFPVEVVADAKSVFDALAANPVKPPEEKTMLLHLLKVREWLDHGVVRRLWWCDTDDMLADGMTKGAVDRDAILQLCNNGLWNVLKKPASFSSVETMMRQTSTATGC